MTLGPTHINVEDREGRETLLILDSSVSTFPVTFQSNFILGSDTSLYFFGPWSFSDPFLGVSPWFVVFVPFLWRPSAALQ